MKHNLELQNQPVKALDLKGEVNCWFIKDSLLIPPTLCKKEENTESPVVDFLALLTSKERRV